MHEYSGQRRRWWLAYRNDLIWCTANNRYTDYSRARNCHNVSWTTFQTTTGVVPGGTVGSLTLTKFERITCHFCGKREILVMSGVNRETIREPLVLYGEASSLRVSNKE